jgi:hypothetical protein
VKTRAGKALAPCLLVAAVHLGVASGLAAGSGTDYRPPQFANAENYLRVQFLPAGRDWERMDIYVPKAAPQERLPCVVFFYGGGWGGKVMWGKDNTQLLLDSGYVVAVPDYVLGAQQPVPLAVWDGAAAIRFLRANAAKYRIDPERIAVIGLSAGGWLAQYLAPSDSATLWRQGRRGEPQFSIPMVEPHPANAEFPARVAAFVTDWGAGRLGKSPGILNPGGQWLGPDDPPLFTCGPLPETFVPNGPQAYRAAGAIAEVASVGKKAPTGGLVADVKNPHDYGHCLLGVAVKNYLTRDKTGKEVTFGERTLQFLEEYVKRPRTASAPEIFPHGGPIPGPTAVRLRSVHPDASIHFTLDGSDPADRSPVFQQPLTAKPGDTLKAVATKPGLKPSPIATAAFVAAPCAPPTITTTERLFQAKVGQPFSVSFQATCDRAVSWYLSGKVAAKALEAVNPKVDNSKMKREPPWLALDPKTGVLSGTPPGPGVSVLIVTAQVAEGQTTLCDAVCVIVVAE